MKKNYAEELGIKPTGTYYVFDQGEINNLVREFVKKETGFDLGLTVGCLGEPYDVYVSWGDSEELISAFFEQGNLLGLHPEEDFMNRDHIFQAMFGVQFIGYEHDFDSEYTLFIPSDQN